MNKLLKIGFSLLTLSLSLILCGFTQKEEQEHILRETHDGVTMTYAFKDNSVTVEGNGKFQWDYQNYFYHTIVNNEELKPKKFVAKEGITEISFSGAGNVEEISLPSSLTTLKSAFSGCKNLKNITLPQKLTTISASFSSCSRLNNVTIPKSVTKIQNSFNGSPALTNISFKGAIEIDNSFGSCSALKAINLPDNSILCSAFNRCESLKTIRLGANVSCHDIINENCNESFLRSETAVRSIYANEPLHMEAATAITSGISELNMGSSTTKLIPVPKTSGGDPSKVPLPQTRYTINFDEKSGTLTLEGTGVMKDLYPRTLDSVYEGWHYPALIEEDKSVKKLVIKEGITELYNCFNDLKSVEEIQLPKSLKKVEFSFIGCSALKEVTIPKELKTISGYSFDKCSSLKKLTLQGPIDTCIIGGAFNHLDSLTEVTIPEGSALCDSFKHCKNLAKVTLAGYIDLHENLHEDENHCNGNFEDAKTNCTFYLNSYLKEQVSSNSNYPSYSPILDFKNYKFVIPD